MNKKVDSPPNVTKYEKFLLFPQILEKYLDKEEINLLSNPYFVKSFKHADKDNIFSNEFEQSAESYILSKKRKRKSNSREENKTTTEHKDTIILSKLLLTTKKSEIEKYNKIINGTKTLMENFFNLKVEIDSKLKTQIKKNKSKYTIFDKINKTEYNLRYNNKHKNFDVFDFLYAIPNFIEENALSFICFTDVNLHEGSPQSEIFGRVLNLSKNYAVVSLNNELDSETMITALHETMHTFGLSHCKYWDCIMNAKNDCNNHSCMSLCPLDMIKLKIFNPAIDFIKRYKNLKMNFKGLEWEDDEKEMEEKIKILKKN